MKKRQKAKSSSKFDGDYASYAQNITANPGEPMDFPASDDDAKPNKKQGITPKMAYSMMYNQLVPAVTKIVFDLLKDNEKIALAQSSAQDTVLNQEKAQPADDKDRTFEIDIFKIMRYLLRRWKSLCAFALLGGVIGFLISSFVLTPKYTSTADLYVTNKNTVDSSNVNINDINASQKLVDTYIVMLQTNSITDEVLNKLNDNNIQESTLLRYLKFSSVNKTEVLRITVETESPELSYRICTAYAEVASKSLESIVGSGSVTILSHPKTPRVQSFPNVPKFTALFAFVFGVMLIIVYMLRLATRVTISDEKTLLERYNIPVLGSVPDFFRFAKVLGISKKEVKLNNKLKKRNIDNEKIYTAATIIDQNTPFPIDSAYKSIRTNMMFRISTMDDKGVFVITSPTANDLKTTTTINLAISMAQMGAKVLLVDGDLRNPSIYKYFKVSNRRGLSRVLMGFETFDESVIRDVRPGVDFLSAGASTPSPAELLGSNYMIDFVNTQSQDYDFVFIDTSPINLVSDSLMTLDPILVAVYLLDHLIYPTHLQYHLKYAHHRVLIQNLQESY